MSTSVGQRSWCVVVPHHPRGARLARHRLATELRPLVVADLLADTTAVVAELLGNAVSHASALPGGVIRLAWRVVAVDVPQLVEVRVTDGGSNQLPEPRPARPDALDGRGLVIVAALALRWGVERDGLGQCVWAELGADRAGPVPASPVPGTLDLPQGMPAPGGDGAGLRLSSRE